MARPKKEKGKKKEEWKENFPPESYRKTLSESVHFSAKITNSNTPKFGIRLGPEDRIDLPYVALSTTDCRLLQTDYADTAGSASRIFSQIRAVLEGNEERMSLAPIEEIESIREALQSSIDKHYESPDQSVGIRLRQIIVQDASGQDVVLTPLNSAVFSKLIEDRLLEVSAKPKRGVIGIGGSRPDNVGACIHSMTRPLFFKAPEENRSIKKVFAFYYNGVSLRIPNAILVSYYEWRKDLLRLNNNRMPSSLEFRNYEKDFLADIVKIVMGRAERAESELFESIEILPEGKEGKIVSPEMPFPMQGLIHSGLRTKEWKESFARFLHKRILDSPVWINGESLKLDIGEIESQKWISILEDLL